MKGNQVAAAVFFLIMPFLILLVSSVAGYLLKHTVPQLYDILSGGGDSNADKCRLAGGLFHSLLANLLRICYCKTNSRRYSHCKNIINSRSGAFARIYQEDMAKETEKKVDNF